ncbi:MAG: hypothetical protein DLM69_02400 [Candidatus Chloroheliales bacterium]|nr:MAG: hypothetical protein DLM69_02400 [Chloroflexota bacterium]
MVQTHSRKNTLSGNELGTRYRALVREVDSLPPEMLTDLMHHILDAISQQLVASSTHPAHGRGTLEQALGYLATDEPAPTDEEVQRVIDEYRMEKYG